MSPFFVQCPPFLSAFLLGRGGKKMAATIPGLLAAPVADQSHPGLMDQGSGLQSLTGFFLGQPDRGQLPEFVVNQRQQLLRRRWIAGLDLRKNACNVSHGWALKWTTPAMLASSKSQSDLAISSNVTQERAAHELQGRDKRVARYNGPTDSFWEGGRSNFQGRSCGCFA